MASALAIVVALAAIACANGRPSIVVPTHNGIVPSSLAGLPGPWGRSLQGGPPGPPPNGPPGPGPNIVVSGVTAAPDMCGVLPTRCAADGSSANTTRALTYSTATGLFTGNFYTNMCPSHPEFFSGSMIAMNHNPLCIRQTLPAPAYSSTPAAAPLRGPIGYALRGGEFVYNLFDAGFSMGQACTVNYGSCDAGTDVTMCEARLEEQCGTVNLKSTMFMNSCGGHAEPWHYHLDLTCEYDPGVSPSAGHSTLLGIMLDGRGLYGMYESPNAMPTDLDACGGHYGPVPATTLSDGTVYPAASNVYHYHVQHRPPYTIGCYGPVSSLDQAKSLYPTCSSAVKNWTACTSKGQVTDYALDCPVFSMGNRTFNPLAPVPTAKCPNCHGSCTGEYAKAISGAADGSAMTRLVAGAACAFAAALLLVRGQ